MSLTVEEATSFFNFLETQSVHDGKITRSDLEKAVAVDTDGDGQITDVVQTRVLADGTTTTWTEREIVDRNVAAWIQNASEKWLNDEAITLDEFLAMLNVQSA